jgi:hypothetical protein
MYGAHDAINAPLTKKTAVTAARAVRRSLGVVTAAGRSTEPTAPA